MASVLLENNHKLAVRHYLFHEAHNFCRVSLSENSSHLGTNNVREQISVHIFAKNRGYCLRIWLG